MGCSNILKPFELNYNCHNLVVHPSKLPDGRGSAALVNKILEGQNKVYLTLFEANRYIDKGDYYFQEPILFKGTELSDEIRYKQAKKTFELCYKYLNNYETILAKPQNGSSTFYKRRTPKNSEINLKDSIKSQFNLLRVVDNKRYPAFFFDDEGNKKILEIYRDVYEPKEYISINVYDKLKAQIIIKGEFKFSFKYKKCEYYLKIKGDIHEN